MLQCLPSERADWLVAGLLIVLGVVPVVSGTVRLFSLRGVDASPVALWRTALFGAAGTQVIVHPP